MNNYPKRKTFGSYFCTAIFILAIVGVGILVVGAISQAEPKLQTYAWSVLGGVAFITVIACRWRKK